MLRRLMATTVGVACAVAAQVATGQSALHEQLWVDYNASWTVTPKLSLYGDLGARSDLESATNWKQLVIRPGMLYNPGADVRLTAGLASFDTFVDGSLAQSELRVWQGVSTAWPGSIGIDHYFRAEERIYFNTENGDASWSLRTRYSAQMPIALKTWDSPRYLRLYLSTEGFITIGPDPRERHRQVRAIVGIEHGRSRSVRVRFDTMLEWAWRYQTIDSWTALYLRLRVYQRLN